MICPRACPALAIGSYGVIRPPTSITSRGSATSAAQRPASSNASTMRSVRGAGRRGMGNRGSRAAPHHGCELAAVSCHLTGRGSRGDFRIRRAGVARWPLMCKIAHRYNTEALAICDGRLRLRPGAGMLKRSGEVPAALAGLHDTLLAAAASGIVHLRLKRESKC
jgi:hypothetical protein